MTDRAPAYPEISAQDTARRLTDSFRSVEWAVSIVPPQWTHALPDYYGPNDWTVAMNLAHLVVYEEKFATPLLEALAAGDDGEGAVPSPGEGWLLRDATAIASEPVEVLLERLANSRARQVQIVESFPRDRFNEPVTPL